MSSLRIAALLAATVIAASNAAAQGCLGNSMAGKTYLGFQTRSSWIGQGQQRNVYGGELAHRFELGTNTAITASITGAGNSLNKDSAAVSVGGTLAISRRLESMPNITVCAATGVEAHALDVSPGLTRLEDGYAAFPLTLGMAYDIQAGNVLITPFVAPTLARYEFETLAIANGARQHGWDYYTTMGASAVMGRVSASASYRKGDLAMSNKGRWTLGTGFTF